MKRTEKKWSAVEIFLCICLIVSGCGGLLLGFIEFSAESTAMGAALILAGIFSFLLCAWITSLVDELTNSEKRTAKLEETIKVISKNAAELKSRLDLQQESIAKNEEYLKNLNESSEKLFDESKSDKDNT